MSNTRLMAAAVGPVLDVVREIKPDQLALPTPCTEYDVRRLVHHLLFWGPSLEGAARKEIVAPPAPAEGDVDLTDGDWNADLRAHLERTATAWSAPDAWHGTTYMGAPNQMPADLIGGMIAGEFVVHGWDLARATGQRPVWDEDLLAHLYAETGKSVEMGRGMGMFAAEVAVPATADTLDRLVGLTGRDPGWTA
jgi:uncharacterized protein (TIGR03086 family)